MSASWWQASDSNSWEWRSNDWKAQSWNQSAWDNQSSSNLPTTQCPTPTFPASYVSDANHYDKTPVGKGCHVLHRAVQPTEWSRKAGLAGRDITDVRAYELSHRGLADFSFRLLSEGRHQSIVWARSGSESVLLTALLKKIRESGISIDEAAQACHSAAVPDKHKEAMRFMEPLAQELLKCLEAKAPAKNPDVADELAKAKAKMAEHGITMSPVKRKHDQDSEPSNSADKRAKPTLPHAEPESQSEAQQLLSDSYRKLDSRPKGATNEHVAEWLAGFKTKPEFKGKYQQLVKYVGTVQELFKSGTAKDEMVEAATRFGLDSRLAARLTIKNLSAVIAVAQFRTA